MIFGSLFSGIGAPEAAWSPLGWRCAWQAEIDAFPSAVLAHHYPTAPNLGDVTEIDPDAVEPVELVVFGSPCQDFSIAGKRRGMDGERGNLTLVALALVAKLRPRWLVFENVPGLLSNWSGDAPGDLAQGEEREADQYSDMAAFLGTVRECGYLGCWRVLDAQFAGVPQRRRRIIFVGYLGDWRPAAAVLLEPESLRGDIAPRREAGQEVARPIAGCPDGGSGWRADADTVDNLIAFHGSQDPDISGEISHPMGNQHNGFGQCIAYGIDSDCLDRSGEGRPNAVAFGGNNTTGPVDVATACNAHGGPHGRLDFESETFVAHSLRADGFDASEDGTGRGTPLVPVAFQEAQTGVREYADAGSLRANGPGHDPVGTRIRSGMSVRRLTPRECERLQGFPDDYTAITYRRKPAADGPRYRALGNSMAVPVIRWIGERIAAFEAAMTPVSSTRHSGRVG